MSNAGAKTKGKTAAKKEATQEQEEVVPRADIAAIRQNATNLIGVEASEMVKAVIAECKKGHYQSLKFLFEVAGIFPASAEAADHDEPSFAEILCRRLGLPAEMPADSDVTNDSCETEDAVEHTVE